MQHFSDLKTEERNKLINEYHLPMVKSSIYVDEFGRPYEQTNNGRIYCSRKKEYQYQVKN